MRENGIEAKQQRAFKTTTDSDHNLPVAPNVLNRQFEADAPNEKWTCDITYVATREGWLYLSVVLDLFSRRVVGHAMKAKLSARVGYRGAANGAHAAHLERQRQPPLPQRPGKPVRLRGLPSALGPS